VVVAAMEVVVGLREWRNRGGGAAGCCCGLKLKFVLSFKKKKLKIWPTWPCALASPRTHIIDGARRERTQSRDRYGCLLAAAVAD
jgi:hypothetical protein